VPLRLRRGGRAADAEGQVMLRPALRATNHPALLATIAG
jgi:hypothetical protein